MNDYYKQKGFEESALQHGNPDILSAFFDQIYQQLILDPEYKEHPNPRLNQHEQEKLNLEKKIDDLKNKIQDVKNDEEKFRKEKKEREEIARKHDLENSKAKFNPKLYNTLQLVTILLVIVIFVVYSIFFMHLFSKPTAKIFPPFNELISLIQDYWYACILAIIPLGLGYVIDLFFRGKSKYKIYSIIGVGLISLFLDFIIANATRTRIADANELLGLTSPPLLLDTNFWIVLLLGPLPIILLSIILYQKHKNSQEYIEELSKNPFKDIVDQLREKELNRKYKAEELDKELSKNQNEFNRLLNFTEKIQYLPKEQLDTRVFSFYNGWTEWITNFYNQAFERQYGITRAERLTKCKEEFDKFNQESQSKFKTIYPTF